MTKLECYKLCCHRQAEHLDLTIHGCVRLMAALRKCSSIAQVLLDTFETNASNDHKMNNIESYEVTATHICSTSTYGVSNFNLLHSTASCFPFPGNLR